jgi:murein DD-endopeptidase MepM/ murein hydrolase activator NlpD
VYATGRGVVVDAEWDGDYGRVVRIDHGDGYMTVYAHLSNFSVGVGEQVNRGTQVGQLGSSGRSTGPHLHYEVRIDGDAVDSRDYLP